MSALGLFSCASLLGVEDYKDSAGELCDLLEACYGYENCQQHIGPSLDAASPAVRTLWLASLSDKACLEQCTSARRCLNIEPVCLAQGDACGRIEDCCGFLSGTAGCEALADGQKRCCLADGMTCTDGGQCCSAICDERTNTCSGEICSAVGQHCKSDIYCCTELCGPDNLCLEHICSTEGQACVVGGAECCVGLTCLDGRCGVGPNCRGEGEKCFVDSPNPAEGCCTGECVPTNTEGQIVVGLCSKQGCLPESADCTASPTRCCPGTVCDQTKKQCGELCQGKGAPCVQGYECCSGSCVDGACECSEGACNGPGDCCVSPGSKGACIAGACAPMCGTTACHDICTVGAPMDAATCQGEPTLKTDAINYVCTNDPYCCCVKWDDLCAESAAFKALGCM